MNKAKYWWKIALLIMSSAILLLDQTSKAWASKMLQADGDVNVISNFLNFIYAENTGAAFSFLDNHSAFSRWAFSIVASIAAIAVFYFFWKPSVSNRLTLGALSLLLAGILGNLIDRVRLGYVVDFIQVHYKDWYYPTMNVADITICVGAGLLILDLFFNSKKEATNRLLPVNN
jgi:signal peptidase II